MCLIIHKPAGVEIPAPLIRMAWEDNNDGAGIMYHPPGAAGATVIKLLPKEVTDPTGHLIARLKELQELEVGVHFRWKTHGPIDKQNTHPYPLPGGSGWLMHNGIIAPTTLGPQYNSVRDFMSDTGFYVVSTLQGAPGADDTAFWEIVGQDVGSYNKMLILDSAGRFLRVNDKQWEDYKGLRLSNIMSCPEYSTGMSKWWRGHSIDYSNEYPDMGTARRADEEPMADIIEVVIGTESAPARLTRRERKVMNACLRSGNWGPFRRMTR